MLRFYNPKEEVSALESLAPHLQMRLFLHLTADDRSRMAVASRLYRMPRRTKVHTNNQTNKKKKKNKRNSKNGAANKKQSTIQNEKTTVDVIQAAAAIPADDDVDTAAVTASTLEANSNEQVQEESETWDEETTDALMEQNAETDTKEQVTQKPVKKSNVPVGVEDPDTLLARLNTRRLGQRCRHFRSLSPEEQFEIYESVAYPRHKTIEEIAAHEWKALIQKYSQRFDVTQHFPEIPSPYELMMFSEPKSKAAMHLVTVLASYPRSGNSLMRNLYERVSLRVTGSDMRGGLTKHDLVGEAAVSFHKVSFVKTHYPERRGFPAFWASKVVLLVRNPYDAIESYFNLMMTNTHTTSISEETRKQHVELWERMAFKEVQVWKAFHEFWLQQKIPILLVRYEDLIRHQSKVMAKVVKFIFEVKNMKFFDGRINHCITKQEIEQLGSYRPRSGGIGKSLAKYSPDLLQKMNSIGLLSTMEKLGYDEMLVPNKDEWKLDPLEGFGLEFPCANKEAKILINGGKLSRSMHHCTDWKSVRRAMNVEKANKCGCPKCQKWRK